MPLNINPIALVFDLWSVSNYFHWIVESLPRLLILSKHHPNCALLVPYPTPEYIISTAHAMGFTNLVPICSDEIMLIPKLILPRTVLSTQSDLPSYEESTYIQLIKNNILNFFTLDLSNNDKKCRRRIYSSRHGSSLRVPMNEKELYELLESFGFEIINFKEMTMYEQISIMQETHILIGVHGANLTNLIFLPPNAIVIEIAAPTLINNVYYRLALYNSLSYYYISCIPDTLDTVNMTGKIDLEALSDLLNELN